MFEEIASFYENYHTEPWNESQDPASSPLSATTPSAVSEQAEQHQDQHPEPITSLTESEQEQPQPQDSSPSYQSTPLTPSTPPLSTMPSKTPSFAFCGSFTGKEMSAARWLKSFEHDLTESRGEDSPIPPATFLHYLDLLLREDAAVWAETNADAIRLLNITSPTQTTVDQFVSLFKQKFPAKIVETAPVTFDSELADLRQQPDETIMTYYTRTLNMMQKYGATDRTLGSMLTLAEGSLLDTFLRAWVKGLADQSVKRKAAEGMGDPNRSLRAVYGLAEQAKLINAEIKRLFDEESKEDELSFYRGLAEKNLSTQQLSSMLATHHASRVGQARAPAPASHQWSVHEDTHVPNHYSSHRQEPQPPPYRSEGPTKAPTYLAQNPSRVNAGAGQAQRPRRFQPVPSDLPDRKTSNNSWINGSKIYSRKEGVLCVKCGHLGHTAKECEETSLPAWEQSYLKELVFGDAPRSSFAAAGYGEFDGQARPYGSRSNSLSTGMYGGSSSSEQTVYTPSSPSSKMSGALSSSGSNMVSYGMAGLYRPEPEAGADSKALMTFYGEGSGPNKRPHVEEEAGPSQASQPTLRGSQPAQAQQQPGLDQGSFVQQPFQFQTMEPNRTKRKGQRKAGKKVEAQPLVGMFNERIGSYDQPVSIRAILQDIKFDISLMDFVAWSPAAGREMKRLVSKVPKKRVPKDKQPFYQFNPGVQQPFQPMQTVPGVPGLPGMPQQNQFMPAGQPQQPYRASGGSSSLSASAAEKNTRFLATMGAVEKAWRVPCSVTTPSGKEVNVERRYNQVDQGSEMSVVSVGMVNHLGLVKRSLAEVGFRGLSMRTADHRETLLLYWALLPITVADIKREVRCFVSPELTHTTEAGEVEHLSIILGIPWLYSVDAKFGIRDSTILIGDVSVGETVRAIQGPQMVFCKDHNLLMYPKSIMAPHASVKSESPPSSSSESSSSEEDDLSDVEELPLINRSEMGF